ncbi:hypothetical protein [Kitasatospora sp. NPDC089509]|uniref:hypothetical protein n=1 Tax=Kitasatospora sp. NPDC089509 TaxID=3364079 RepID=UPI003816BF9F
MVGMSLAALDAVVWDGLATAHPSQPVEAVPQALRQLALAGEEATEGAWNPLYSLITREGQETPTATAVALPFVIALAADPAVGAGARRTLVELLVAMRAPSLAGEDWSGARALLADPDPAVRREALPLAEGVAPLLERWRVETDPTVRLPLLLRLGEAVPGEEGADVDAARAVLAQVLEGDDPVMWVAAVHASAEFDRDLPVRQLDRLIDVFSDPALRPRFEAVWFTPAVDGPWTREELVRATAWILAPGPGPGPGPGPDADPELRFAVRLVETARRTGDAALCREALDVAWRLLVERRSVEPALLPLAGGLLTSPDAAVRLRAAHVLAVLGPAAAGYADGLVGLLEDRGGDEFLDGTVGEIARWALARTGDPRALPGLIAQLRAQEEELSRAYCSGDPRRPEVADVLVPLRAHADVLLPAIRETLRQDGAPGGATGAFLTVLEEWGEDARPALPELLPLLTDTRTSIRVLKILSALGPAAAAAAEAVRTCVVLDSPGNHALVAWTTERLADRAPTLQLVGEAVMTAEEPWYGPIDALADFGPEAAPYADRVRFVMENGEPWARLTAATTLWSITGRVGPSLRVLEEPVVSIAAGGDGFGLLRHALRTLVRMGTVSGPIRAALLTIRQSDRRLSVEGAYRAIIHDGELRDLVDQALACTDEAGDS